MKGCVDLRRLRHVQNRLCEVKDLLRNLSWIFKAISQLHLLYQQRLCCWNQFQRLGSTRVTLVERRHLSSFKILLGRLSSCLNTRTQADALTRATMDFTCKTMLPTRCPPSISFVEKCRWHRDILNALREMKIHFNVPIERFVGGKDSFSVNNFDLRCH